MLRCLHLRRIGLMLTTLVLAMSIGNTALAAPQQRVNAAQDCAVLA
jgi:hypothetical protein